MINDMNLIIALIEGIGNAGGSEESNVHMI